MLGRVPAAGTTTNPDSAFIAQVARNLTDDVDGFLRSKRFLIVDRDSKFTEQLCRVLHDAGVEIVRTCYQAPNMNALAERWVQPVKRECLHRVIVFGAAHLRRALREYLAHDHDERPHQGIENTVIGGRPGAGDGEVVETERLGGLLRSYHRAA